MSKLKLSAIRLVGFHNYDDELIEVVGDLFIVGINESGKTTILDALHLVLSGGQNWDLNAAAKMAGRRDDGRTLNGIILRANLSGKPARSGGSITYAVAEFEEADGKRPVTFVFGASVTDMRARASKWGMITKVRAADLELVADDGDGVRIRNRDELELIAEGELFKNMNKYRTAVADRLFGKREDFDRITELWRQAKSYRELAKSAPNIGDLFRQVLPEPDVEPFDKVAKGFQDIATIEQQLADLREDVTALHGLEESVRAANEARGTRRRYEYIGAKFELDRGAKDLHNENKRVVSLENEIRNLEQEVSKLEQKEQSFSEQLAKIRSTSAYKDASVLENLNVEIEGIQAKVDSKRRLLNKHHDEVKQAQSRQERLRSDATAQLDDSMQQLEVSEAAFEPIDLELQQSIADIRDSLPETIDAELTSSKIRDRIEATRALSTTKQKAAIKADADAKNELGILTQELSRHKSSLERLQKSTDLVPELDGLDNVLEALESQGIQYRFLFQEIEFKRDTTETEMSIVESAIGMGRLATIVVDPESHERAKQIVLGSQSGLRILDSVSVKPIESATGNPSQNIASYLQSKNKTVQSHIDAVFATIRIANEPVADGSNSRWFARDGEVGERGARRRSQHPEPKWIGEKRRLKIRQEREKQFSEQVEECEGKIEVQQKQIQDSAILVQAVENFERNLNGLELPSRLEAFWNQLQSTRSEIARLKTAVSDATNELEILSIDLDAKSESREQVKQQLSGVDIESLNEKVSKLEGLRRDTTERMGAASNEVEAKNGELVKTRDRIPQLESHLVEIETVFAQARDRLVDLLPPNIADLDHYVFATKRGSRIRNENLQSGLEQAGQNEATLLAQLRGSDGVMNNRFASKFRFRVNDEDSLIEVFDFRNDSLASILEERSAEEQKWNDSLDKHNRELIQNVLAHDLISRLNADLTTLDRTIRGLNVVLAELKFGHNRFQLSHRLTQEHAPFVKLIQRQSILNDAEKLELRDHLANRQDALTGEGEIPPFLDYRNWYQFGFRLNQAQAQADDGFSMGRSELVKGSGGAQATHNYLLLFALASFQFDRANAKARVLMMDEAFFGLDSERKELLLRCAKTLKLDLVIASPDLDGTVLGEAYDTTSLLVERDEQDNILVAPLIWEAVDAQGDLFAEPRPEAVIGAERNEDV